MRQASEMDELPPLEEGPSARTCLAVLSLSFMALVGWSWRKSADLVIDFGRELYVPWQLAQGEVLYRDIAALKGPLSAYLNALAFWLFGPSVGVLLVLNVLLTAGLTYLLFDILARTVNRGNALLGCLLFLALFAFPHMGMLGIFNFITPYSHEATHGTVLLTGIVWAVLRWLESGKERFCALAGLCLGATPLTKPEITMAAGAAVVVGLVALRLRPLPGRSCARAALIAGAAAPLPVLGFFLVFWRDMPPAEAAVAAAGGLAPLFVAGVTDNLFYATTSGFDEPWRNLRRFLRSLALVAASCAAAGWLDRSRLGPRLRSPLWILLVVALAALIPSDAWDNDWDIPRSIPAIAALMGGALAALLWRSPPEQGLARRLVPLIMWSVVSLALLSKIPLNSTQSGFGFYLAMPAALLFAVFLTSLVPHQLRVRGSPGDGRVFRGVFVAILALSAIHSLRTRYYRKLWIQRSAS